MDPALHLDNSGLQKRLGWGWPGSVLYASQCPTSILVLASMFTSRWDSKWPRKVGSPESRVMADNS